jgi:hypothetical protein
MTQHILKKIKDLGLKKEVTESLPYAVVGGAWEGTFSSSLATNNDYRTILNHVVPAGKQLKLLFLRVWTQSTNGAIFSIVQTNPTAAGQTGSTEAYPVVGSVPQGVRDYPMLEAAGAEVLRGSLKDPIHVLEGSVDFRIIGPVSASTLKYGLAWWGVQDTPES